MPRLTPWFPADVLPVHVGWYERDWGAGPGLRDYWDGQRWHIGTPDGSRVYNVPAPALPWRGLADPANSRQA